ncbi:MAG: hypothetical protein WD607_01965 [Candidatus Paceibacterota bacterium]
MNKVKTIKWLDAVSYYNLKEMPNKLIEQKTTGEVVEENNDYIVIKDPKTKDYNPNSHRGITEKEKDPTFLFIPKGMIKSVEDKA